MIMNRKVKYVVIQTSGKMRTQSEYLLTSKKSREEEEGERSILNYANERYTYFEFEMVRIQ